MQDLQEKITFRPPWVLKKFLFGSLLVLAEFLGRGFGHRTLGWVGGLVLFAPFLLGRPRKIAISADEITYWPACGTRKTYKFSDITSITPVLVRQEFILAGAKLQFSDGSTATIPLEFYSDDDRVREAMREAHRRYADAHSSRAGGSQTQEAK